MAAWTQADLDVLEAAIASGARTVSFSDRTVTYNSLAEMLQLRALMRAEVQGTAAPDRFSRTRHSRA